MCVVHLQAFLLFIWYTMWASALAAVLLLRSFIQILTVGDFEDTVKCAPARRELFSSLS